MSVFKEGATVPIQNRTPIDNKKTSNKKGRLIFYRKIIIFGVVIILKLV